MSDKEYEQERRRFDRPRSGGERHFSGGGSGGRRDSGGYGGGSSGGSDDRPKYMNKGRRRF